MVFLTSCADVNATSGGVCQGLEAQIDRQADATLVFGETLGELKEDTPERVVTAGENLIIQSGRSVAGFDRGCN